MQYSLVEAQTDRRTLAFNALTINDGLSQGMVVCILQDRYGFMWFATLDGLNRYDGYKFTVYRHDPQDKTSITKSFVKSLFEDSQGRLWIGTVSGGLDLFDRETETFTHIDQIRGNGTDSSEGTVNNIAEDIHGNIWVHVSDRLNKITINENEKSPVKKFLIQQVQVPFKSDASILTITKTGHVYFANSRDGVLYKLNDEKKGNWSIAFNLNPHPPRLHQNGSLLYRIVQLIEDKTNAKFYVFHDGGVTRFDERTGTEERTFRNASFKIYDSPLRGTLDKSGIVWFSGLGNLSLFDTRTGELKIASALDNTFSRTLSGTYSIFIDRSGLLWIGTAGYGLLKRNTRSESFHHTGSSSNYSIKELPNGKIVLGNAKVVREVFDRSAGTFVDVSGKSEVRDLNNFLLRRVATDKSGDWYAESDKLRYQHKILDQATYYHVPFVSNSEYTELIQCTVKDLSGNIWLGTTEGLAHFSLADKRWSVFKNKPNDQNSLSSNVIFSLCLDPLQPKKYLWVGTSGGGLNRMDMATGACIAYTTKDGLPNNVVYGILNDDDGNLWMSTNKGLSCFNPSKQSFQNFDHKDGLQSNEFNRGAYTRTKDGWLFFGGVNGFNYFSPREILKNTTAPRIVITGMKIRNQTVPVQTQGSPLTKSIYLTEKLTLPYTQNFISLEFASLDFTNPEKNRYQFRLQGFDKDWINSGTSNNATYTNLDPGTYTFEVQGSNNDGTWNKKETSLQLIILPPWYMTWWFRSAVVVTLIAVGYILYKYRLSQAAKLQSIRDRIAGDLHDEVGSNLSNIYIFSNVAQQKAAANGETSPLLQKITDYTQQSMEAMNDIVWMINTRNDRFENIMVRMRTLAAEFTETSDCSLHLHFDESLNNVKLNMEERKNFYLIYKEAINNTAKYAGCKSLWVEMKLNQNTVTLKIIDNGKGFDMANIAKGNGMFNMKKRAEMLKGALTVISSVGEGTTVNLSFKV